jgi:ribokinase
MLADAPIFVLGSLMVACSARVSRMPVPGESILAEDLTIEAGGKGLNLALAATRLGVPVNAMFGIGTDLFGDFAQSALADLGLGHAVVHRFSGGTGAGVGFTDAQGENRLAVHPLANALLGAAHVRSAEAEIRKAKLVLAQFEIPDEAICEAFRIARAAGACTLLNPSPFRRLDSNILRNTSILILNRVEAAAASGMNGRYFSAREHAGASGASLLTHGPDLVIVTLGADGAVACRRGEEPVYQPAFLVDVVDTLGAGDAFAGAFAAGIVEGDRLQDALRRASACGAITCMTDGVADALPTWAALESFLGARETT